MEDKVKEELEELIKEGCKFRFDKDGEELDTRSFPMYYAIINLSAQGSYINWSELVERFIRIHYFEESEKFIKIKNKEMYTLPGLIKLISMLEAIKKLPQRIEKKEETRKRLGDTHIYNNINQSQSQEQKQDQKIINEFFWKIISYDLSPRQQDELKKIISEHKDDSEKVKTKLVEKLLSFGKDVASNILANILTNPNMLGHF